MEKKMKVFWMRVCGMGNRRGENVSDNDLIWDYKAIPTMQRGEI